MSVRSPAKKTEITYHEAGVLATRSTTGYCISLPRPNSTNHQLSIVASLWDAWAGTRNDASDPNMVWTINVAKLEELPPPIIAVLSAIDAELSQEGHMLFVIGSPHPMPLAMSIP